MGGNGAPAIAEVAEFGDAAGLDWHRRATWPGVCPGLPRLGTEHGERHYLLGLSGVLNGPGRCACLLLLFVGFGDVCEAVDEAAGFGRQAG